MLPYIPTGARRVLDVGCHTGAFGSAVKEARDIEVWGVEPNPVTALQARDVLDKVVCAPFEDKVPIPDEYFDVVVFNDVLEHLVDPWSALRLARRKLGADGRLIASIPNLRHIDNLLHIVMERDFEYEIDGIRDKTHLRFFTKTSISRLFLESGYEVRIVEGINEAWWTPSILRRLMFRLLKDTLEDTKYMQFAVVAEPQRELIWSGS